MAITDAEVEALEADILTNASGPASASTDMGSVSQHSLADQIAYLEFLESRTRTTTRKRGLMFSKFVPPGSD